MSRGASDLIENHHVKTRAVKIDARRPVFEHNWRGEVVALKESTPRSVSVRGKVRSQAASRSVPRHGISSSSSQPQRVLRSAYTENRRHL